MNSNDEIKISRFLSLVLRHKPEIIGLTLDKNGWTDTKELIDQAKAKGIHLTTQKLKKLVDTNDKNRFVLSPDLTKIRANQGHSVEVDLDLPELQPPVILYHGTAQRNIESIKAEGLLKGKRHHVHLSFDPATAVKVGMRYGKPVVLEIDAMQMYDDGYKFFRSENGVWLTDFVPSKYIK